MQDSSTHQADQHQPNQRFYYRVGTHNLLMEANIQAEVLLDSQTSPLPFSPAWCKGLIAVRGELYPLIDLHHILYGKPNPNQGSLLWLQASEQAAVVIQCDQYPKPIDLSQHPAESDNSDEEESLPSWIDQRLSINQAPFLVTNHTTLVNNLLYSLST